MPCTTPTSSGSTWPGIGGIFSALRDSIWAVMMPVVVLGGIYLGVFTATEAAGIGALYALFVALVVYRTVTWRDIAQCLWDTMLTSAMLFMIIAAAGVFGHAITLIRLPNVVIETVTQLGLGQTGFLFLVMVAIFFLGMFLETIAFCHGTTAMIDDAGHYPHAQQPEATAAAILTFLEADADA